MFLFFTNYYYSFIKSPLYRPWRLALAIFGLCPVLLMLSGCGALTTFQATPKSQAVTVQLATWGSAEEMTILKKRLEAFHQSHPGIHVRLMHIPENYFQKLHILAAAGLMPDVVFVNSLYFPVYASHGFFRDLRTFLARTPQLSEQDFYPQALTPFEFNASTPSTATHQRALGALPRDVSNLVVFINQDLFKQAGLLLPNAQWTWGDLTHLVQRLTTDTNHDGRHEQYGVSFYRKPALFVLPFLWSAGGGLLENTAQGSALLLSNPQSISGIEFYQNLYTQGWVPKRTEVGDATMSQLFLQGKLAMLISGRWSVPVFRQQASFSWDIRPFPAGPAGSHVGVDSSGYALASQSKHPNEAWQVIAFLSAAESQQALTRSGLIIPARRDIAESQTFLQPTLAPTSSGFFLSAIETGIPTQSHPRWNELEETFVQGLDPVWDGKMTAKNAVKTMLPALEHIVRERFTSEDNASRVSHE